MKQLIRFGSVATLLVAFFGTVQISEAKAPNAVFEKLYSELKIAMADRDAKAIGALLAPGFTSEDTSGKDQSAEQMLAELSTLPQDPNKKSQTTVLSVAVNGKIANVVQQYHMTTRKVSQSGEAKVIELNATSNDTWELIGGSWKQLRTVTMQMDYSVNGQVLVHKTHAPN